VALYRPCNKHGKQGPTFIIHCYQPRVDEFRRVTSTFLQQAGVRFPALPFGPTVCGRFRSSSSVFLCAMSDSALELSWRLLHFHSFSSLQFYLQHHSFLPVKIWSNLVLCSYVSCSASLSSNCGVLNCGDRISP